MPEAALATRSSPQGADLAVPAARQAAVISVAMAVPERTVGNGPIAERLGVDEAWIVKRTGARERRIAEPEASLADLAATAGYAALARAGLDATEVDLVLVATMTPDAVAPATSPLVSHALGASGAGAVDVGAACNGFLSALALGAAQVDSGRAGVVLVIGADLMSRLTDPDDRATAALFADGAGAVVLSATEGRGWIGPAVLGSDGARADLVTADRRGGPLRMNGHDTFKQAVARMSEASLAALDRTGLDPTDVDLFVYHQANSRILRSVGIELGLDPGRVVDDVPRFGNTGAATIPISLALAEREGRLPAGSVVLAAALGAGLTWGATVIEWGAGDG
jgi:3-oxoacyl-[acyl-carrier-protein] synthase-3